MISYRTIIAAIAGLLGASVAIAEEDLLVDNCLVGSDFDEFTDELHGVSLVCAGQEFSEAFFLVYHVKDERPDDDDPRFAVMFLDMEYDGGPGIVKVDYRIGDNEAGWLAVEWGAPPQDVGYHRLAEDELSKIRDELRGAPDRFVYQVGGTAIRRVPLPDNFGEVLSEFERCVSESG